MFSYLKYFNLSKKEISLILFSTFLSIIVFVFIGALLNKDIFANKQLLINRGSAEIQFNPKIVGSYIDQVELTFKKTLSVDFNQFKISNKLKINYKLLSELIFNYDDGVIKIFDSKFVKMNVIVQPKTSNLYRKGDTEYAIVNFKTNASKKKTMKKLNELAIVINHKANMDYMKFIFDKVNMERHLITAMELDEETLVRKLKPVVSIYFLAGGNFKKIIIAYIILGFFSGAIISFFILFKKNDSAQS